MRVLDHEDGLLEALKGVGVQPSPVRDKQLHADDATEVVEDVGAKEPEPLRLVVSTQPAVTMTNLFRHAEAHPIILDLVLLRRYGADWLDWEPETIESAIIQDFSAGSVSDLNLSKINACKALHLVDSFWKRWEVFTWCTMPLNGLFPDFRTQQVPTVGQVLVAVDIANRIREDASWSGELEAFIKTVYRHDGILVPVPPADFFTLDAGDHKADTHEIDERWPLIRSTGKAPAGDTMVAEQLRRMLHVYQYLEESRSRLRKQMELVPHV
jgi:hypothetical protein